MWTMAKSWISLFFQGRLFADPQKAYRQLLLGVLVTALVFVAARFSCAPIWAASLIAGFIGGVCQPYFFKHLRYR
jgi:hypothetical protein